MEASTSRGADAPPPGVESSAQGGGAAGFFRGGLGPGRWAARAFEVERATSYGGRAGFEGLPSPTRAGRPADLKGCPGARVAITESADCLSASGRVGGWLADVVGCIRA
jgi:hypothetical protein